MIQHRISREQVERKVALLIQTRAALLQLIGSAIGSLSDHSGSSRSLQRGVSSANAAYFTVARVPEFLVRNRELHLGAADSSRSALNRLGSPRSLGREIPPWERQLAWLDRGNSAGPEVTGLGVSAVEVCRNYEGSQNRKGFQ